MRVRATDPLGGWAAVCGGVHGACVEMSWASGSYSEAFLPVAQTTPSSDTTATDGLADPLSSLGLEKRVSQGPWIEGATSPHTGGEAAGGSRSAGAGEWVGRREGERERKRGRKEVRPGRCHCRGRGRTGIRERDCSGAWWGRGLQCHTFGGQVCKSQAGAATCLRLPGTTQGAGAEAKGRGLQNHPRSGTRTG